MRATATMLVSLVLGGVSASIAPVAADSMDDIFFLPSVSLGDDKINVMGSSTEKLHVAKGPGQSSTPATHSANSKPERPEIRDCIAVEWGMATEENPYASSRYECAGDNGTLLAGEFTYFDPSTGELVELGEPVVIYLTQSQLQSLPIETGAVHVAGWSGQWLIHHPMPVHSDAAAHTLTTTVLGVPVEVRVTPVEFRWDYGHDVAPVVTSTGGGPHPEHATEAAWTTAGEGRTVTATTQWQGEFRVQGFDTWLPVNGTASTTTVSDPVEIIEAPARLVPNP